MVDPVSAAAVGATGKALDGIAGEAGGLFTRMFGPAADEIGEALRRRTAYRVNNAERIVSIADRKSRETGRSGIVPPRLAHSLVEAGSFCDDEVMGDYLGGVLAGGRTPGGRDDRAVTWSSLITQMSAFQIRAHYLLYDQWASLAARHPDRNLVGGVDVKSHMYADLDEFLERLAEVDPDVPAHSLMAHVIGGLVRMDLISSMSWGYGDSADVVTSALFGDTSLQLPFDRALHCMPSMSGIELWGWGHGQPDVDSQSFKSIRDVPPIVEPLTSAFFPLDAEPNSAPQESTPS